jgi:hypothetical protein
VISRFLALVASAAVTIPAPVVAAGIADFLGRWKVTEAKIAPWYDGTGATPATDPTLQGKTITFAAHSAGGSSVVACKEVIYKVSVIGPDMLFEGGLKNPHKDAVALHFRGDKIESLNVGCNSNSGDMELDFPMVDRDTLLLGFNNMVYTLNRAH